METEFFDIVAGVLKGDTLAPYLFIICLYYVLRTSIYKIKENGFELTKKEAEGSLQKQLLTLTTPMTERFWQIHPTKQKHYYIVWNEPPQALASMSMHTKLILYALIKQATFPH